MKKLLLFITLFSSALASAQMVDNPYSSDTFNKQRARAVVAIESGIAIGSSVGLYALWYSQYEQSRFHWLNDNYGWLQIDKYGHAATNYHINAFCYNMNRWAGMDKKKAMLIGSSIAIGFQTAVEVFDGFSAAWGASWGDLAFNFLGAGTFISQEFAWEEQRIIWKFSFKNGDYSGFDETVQSRARRLYGSALYESFLKDYNGQTYWLSVNPKSFAANRMEWMPEWLNIAVGYGAEGMLGANWNIWFDENDCYENYEHIPRYRQYFFSLDVDWEKIPTRSKFLRTIAPYLNIIKVPFPTIEYNRIDGLKGRAFYF